MKRLGVAGVRGAAAAVALGLTMYAACGNDDGEAPPQVELSYDVLCPAPGGTCGDAAGPLRVGVAVRDITPEITETFCDCGDDGLCPDAGPNGLCNSAGYPGPDANEADAEFDGHPIVLGGSEPVDDANGNGYFDAVWIAGFGTARPALGVHDPVWARAVVIERGATRVALVALDLVGYFYDQVVEIREAVTASADVDLVLVSASHTHEGPDSVGIWGYDEGTTGVSPAYMAMVRAAVVDAVNEAADGLRPATVRIGEGPVGAAHPVPEVAAAVGVNNVIQDLRDPVVIDDTVRVLQFQDAATAETIATVVNLSSHPEALCADNNFISSDFVHYLRVGLEQGVHRAGVDVPGLGGTALVLNGAVGGMMSPLRIRVVDLDGTVLDYPCRHPKSADDPFFERARAVGELMALDALAALDDAGVVEAEPALSFATKEFRLPIENVGYHAMFLTGVFYGACETRVGGVTRPRRCIYDFDEARQITPQNLPWVETEVAVVNIGRFQGLAVPGELLPEWWLGGYDGAHTGPAQALLDDWVNLDPEVARACTTAVECPGAALARGRACGDDDCRCTGGVCRHENYNPPDLSLAPAGPYLRDLQTRPVRGVLGLTPDELGYIIPLFDYKLDDRLPFVEQAPGHYEETNSIGPGIGLAVQTHLEALLEIVP